MEEGFISKYRAFFISRHFNMRLLLRVVVSGFHCSTHLGKLFVPVGNTELSNKMASYTHMSIPHTHFRRNSLRHVCSCPRNMTQFRVTYRMACLQCLFREFHYFFSCCVRLVSEEEMQAPVSLTVLVVNNSSFFP
jgi:hypothetical protein